MKFKIEWTVFLRVKDERKATKVLTNIEEKIGLKVEGNKIEKYWKDKTLWKADFITYYSNEMNVQEAVFTTLELLNEVGSEWSIHSPKKFKDDETGEIFWTFEAVCDSPKLIGVHWVQIVMSTNTC